MHLTPFTFETIQIKEACWIDGKPYFTRRAIGEWLEYAHPNQTITKIVERNLHIKEFSTVVKLTTVENGRDVIREVEVYDPIGLQLIVNKSNQPKALLFQITVAHLVVAFMRGELPHPHCASDSDLIKNLNIILSLPPNEQATEKRLLAQQTGKSYRTIQRYLAKYKAGCDPTVKNYGKNKGKYFAISPVQQELIKKIFIKNPRIKPVDLLNLPLWDDKQPSADTLGRFLARLRHSY